MSYENGIDDEVCEKCGRTLVWHDGVYSGWIHSHDFEENERLYQECQQKGYSV
jgi:hypothetical protein